MNVVRRPFSSWTCGFANAAAILRTLSKLSDLRVADGSGRGGGGATASTPADDDDDDDASSAPTAARAPPPPAAAADEEEEEEEEARRRRHDAWRGALGRESATSTPALQRAIETAWKDGFDPRGAAQLDRRLRGTRKWIGATEARTAPRVSPTFVIPHRPEKTPAYSCARRRSVVVFSAPY